MTTKNLQLNPTGYTLVSATAYGFLENTTNDIVEYATAKSLPAATFRGHVLHRDESRWWELSAGESLYAKTKQSPGIIVYTE